MYATAQNYRLPRPALNAAYRSASTTAIYTPRNLSCRPLPPLPARVPVRYRQNVVVTGSVRPPMPTMGC